jgi:hypothetical protein
MPLPMLDPEQPGQAHAAKLEEPTTIVSSNLALDDRIATLSNRAGFGFV